MNKFMPSWSFKTRRWSFKTRRWSFKTRREVSKADVEVSKTDVKVSKTVVNLGREVHLLSQSIRWTLQRRYLIIFDNPAITVRDMLRVKMVIGYIFLLVIQFMMG